MYVCMYVCMYNFYNVIQLCGYDNRVSYINELVK